MNMGIKYNSQAYYLIFTVKLLLDSSKSKLAGDINNLGHLIS